MTSTRSRGPATIPIGPVGSNEVQAREGALSRPAPGSSAGNPTTFDARPRRRPLRSKPRPVATAFAAAVFLAPTRSPGRARGWIARRACARPPFALRTRDRVSGTVLSIFNAMFLSWAIGEKAIDAIDRAQRGTAEVRRPGRAALQRPAHPLRACADSAGGWLSHPGQAGGPSRECARSDEGIVAHDGCRLQTQQRFRVVRDRGLNEDFQSGRSSEAHYREPRRSCSSGTVVWCALQILRWKGLGAGDCRRWLTSPLPSALPRKRRRSS